MMKKYTRFLKFFGPGIFAIGYTIGTGSVTSMIVAGNNFGMELLWVLFLSCLFSGVLINVSGTYYLTTNETLLYSIQRHLPFGKILAWLIVVTVGLGQWNSLIGIVGITSNVIFEILVLNYPLFEGHQYEIVLGLALFIIGSFYVLLLNGNYSLFEKTLAIFVSLMGLSFVFTLFFILPHPQTVIQGLIPKIPKVEGAGILIAAFVGTTMAAATFLSRPLFIQAKGWSKNDFLLQRNDAILAALLIFCISGSIMAVANGSLYGKGLNITHVLDMSQALEPVVGKIAISIFFVGTLSAGLSSIFPCLMIVPLMLGDLKTGQLDVKSSQFRTITAIASIFALSIPVFGVNPIQGQIITQVFNVFGLPIVILCLLLLWNRKNVILVKQKITSTIIILAALCFSLIILYHGLHDIF